MKRDTEGHYIMIKGAIQEEEDQKKTGVAISDKSDKSYQIK